MQLNRRELSLGSLASLAAASTGCAQAPQQDASSTEPWYRRVRRWSQINLTEDDIVNFDPFFWRQFWKDTHTQGVIFNAGGDLAFYPSSVPDHRRAEFLGSGDFFGDLIKASRQEGLAVMARLAYRGTEELMARRPEWLSIDANGKPQKKFCMNGGFIYEHCSAILREVGERYRPDGYTLSGWGENYALCFCPTCVRLFRDKTGLDIPRSRDWDNPDYRIWLEWNADQVMALWDHQNAIARETGGDDCLWVGQLVMGVLSRGMKAISERSPFMMIDYQARTNDGGFEDGTTAGKVFNGLMNWEKPVAQAIALYQNVRLTSSPPAEWGTFMRQAVASGVRPWWHTVGSYSEDKRRYEGVPPVTQWHARNERYLFDRRPVATVGVVWSERNAIYFGRDGLFERVLDPWFGMTHALVRQRIPFVAVNLDHIDRDAASLRALVLPNIGALSDANVASIRRFIEQGGNLVATGDTGLYNEFGEPRSDYALADLFGVHRTADAPTPILKGVEATGVAYASLAETMETAGIALPRSPRGSSSISTQSYLRLSPGLRRSVYGPHHAREPAIPADTSRHPVLAGLEKTDLVIYGGSLAPLRVATGAQPLLTYVPPIAGQPPESAWLRTPQTDIPALVVNVLSNGSRVAFMPAEIDRRYATNGYPDHARLLANAVRWAAGQWPLEVIGPGLLDCSVYRQPGRMIVHIQNLSGLQGRPPAEEFLPVGPITVRVRVDKDTSASRGRALVGERTLSVRRRDEWAEVELASITSHELIVLD